MPATQTSRTVIAALLTALAAAPAVAQQPAQAEETLEQADARVKRMVPEVLRDVVGIRGLSQERKVPAGAMSAPQMREWMEKEIAQEYPASKFAEISRAYVAMGLLPAGTDMRQAMFDLLQDQVGGFYDPKRKRFFLIQTGTRGDSPTDQMVRMQDMLFRRFGLSNDHVVMAHELTHALQDQHFTLTGGLHELKHNDDRVLAAKCVVEGDATLLMQMAEAQGGGGDQAAANPAMANAPRALRVSLAYPYDGGKKFVQVAFKRGGWKAVDGLFAKFPQSTEQVLHPEKYFTDTPDTPVELIFETPADVRGWKVIEDNCVGELMTRVILQEAKLAPGRAHRAAAGWDGDRYIVYAGPGGKTVAVWASEWDDVSEAGDFTAAMHSVMKAAGATEIENFGGGGGPGYFGRLANGTGFYVLQNERRVVVVRGASMDATERIVREVFTTLREDEIRMPAPKAQPAVPEVDPHRAGARRVSGDGFSVVHPGRQWVREAKGDENGRPREIAFRLRNGKRARIVVETRSARMGPEAALAAALEGLREAGYAVEEEFRQSWAEPGQPHLVVFRAGTARYVLIARRTAGRLVTVLGRGPGGARGAARWQQVLDSSIATAKSLGRSR